MEPIRASLVSPSWKKVYTYDSERDILILQTVDAAMNSTMSVEQLPLKSDCQDGAVSDNGAFAVFVCGRNVTWRDVNSGRTNQTYQNTRVSVDAAGNPWADPCSPVSISLNGMLILLQCRRVNSSNSVFPATPLFADVTEGIVLLNLSVPLSRYSDRVIVVPPPWTSTGSVSLTGPVMPSVSQTSEIFGSSFFITYNFIFNLAQNLTSIPAKYDFTTRTSNILAGHANGATFVSGLSESGDFFAFVSAASNLVSYDSNGQVDAFHYSAAANEYRIASVSNQYCSHLSRSSAPPPSYLIAHISFPDTSAAAPTTCPGVRPHPRFICSNSTWILNPFYTRAVIIIRGDIIISDGSTVVFNGTILANGNIDVGCNSTLIIGGGSVSSSDTIRICGTVIIRPGASGPSLSGSCAVLAGGTIVVDVSGLDPLTVANLSTPILSTNCPLPGGNVTARVASKHPDPCKDYKANVVSSGSSLSVVISVEASSAPGCNSSPSAAAIGDSNFNLQIALGASLGAIGLLVVIAIIVVMAVPKFRERVFPFMKRRDDE